MPTITITVTAGQTVLGRTKQISGPDLQNRFIPAWRAAFPGNPPLTDEEVVQHWADS